MQSSSAAQPVADSVAVVGAGVVGLCTALQAQRKGYRVTLIDRDAPGQGASFGNAGYLSFDSLMPLARPSTLKSLPRMLTDRTGPLTVHPPSLPWLLPWMARFALAALSKAEVRKGMDTLKALMIEGLEQDMNQDGE